MLAPKTGHEFDEKTEIIRDDRQRLEAMSRFVPEELLKTALQNAISGQQSMGQELYTQGQKAREIFSAAGADVSSEKAIAPTEENLLMQRDVSVIDRIPANLQEQTVARLTTALLGWFMREMQSAAKKIPSGEFEKPKFLQQVSVVTSLMNWVNEEGLSLPDYLSRQCGIILAADDVSKIARNFEQNLQAELEANPDSGILLQHNLLLGYDHIRDERYLAPVTEKEYKQLIEEERCSLENLQKKFAEKTDRYQQTLGKLQQFANLEEIEDAAAELAGVFRLHDMIKITEIIENFESPEKALAEILEYRKKVLSEI